MYVHPTLLSVLISFISNIIHLAQLNFDQYSSSTTMVSKANTLENWCVRCLHCRKIPRAITLSIVFLCMVMLKVSGMHLPTGSIDFHWFVIFHTIVGWYKCHALFLRCQINSNRSLKKSTVMFPNFHLATFLQTYLSLSLRPHCILMLIQRSLHFCKICLVLIQSMMSHDQNGHLPSLIWLLLLNGQVVKTLLMLTICTTCGPISHHLTICVANLV
mmetsp:Transcript_12106/g.18316  ORF Transcript_12106/g.18316 Transcript_12106/m.18316 type:complete len:216 (-) Transcript_12106:4266-4913(-)